MAASLLMPEFGDSVGLLQDPRPETTIRRARRGRSTCHLDMGLRTDFLSIPSRYCGANDSTDSAAARDAASRAEMKVNHSQERPRMSDCSSRPVPLCNTVTYGLPHGETFEQYTLCSLLVKSFVFTASDAPDPRASD